MVPDIAEQVDHDSELKSNSVDKNDFWGSQHIKAYIFWILRFKAVFISSILKALDNLSENRLNSAGFRSSNLKNHLIDVHIYQVSFLDFFVHIPIYFFHSLGVK